jgi:hypothetical protein
MSHGSGSSSSDGTTAFAWLTGGGQLGDLVRQLDWSRTALGPIDAWPQTLRTSINLVLASPLPIVILWGPVAHLVKPIDIDTLQATIESCMRATPSPSALRSQ